VTAVAVAGALAAAALAAWGLPPVGLQGPLHRLGVMDPLCGGTRAAYFAVTGRWALAWHYNPLGPLAVIASAAMTLRAATGLLSRRWLAVDVTLTRRRLRALYAVAAVGIVVLGVRQQMMAEMLR